MVVTKPTLNINLLSFNCFFNVSPFESSMFSPVLATTFSVDSVASPVHGPEQTENGGLYKTRKKPRL
jgi:hypothetical protein